MNSNSIYRLFSILTIISVLWLSFYSQYHHHQHEKNDECNGHCCHVLTEDTEAAKATVFSNYKDKHVCNICEFLKHNIISSIFQNNIYFDFNIYLFNFTFALLAKEYKVFHNTKSRSPPL